MRGKRLLAMVMASLIAFSPTVSSAAAKNGWFRNKTVYYVNGVKTTGLKKISGKYYFFNTKGKVVKAKWKTVNGKKYYFQKSTGAAVTGVHKINGKSYLFRKNGTLTGTGLATYNGKKYLVKKGIVQIGLNKYKGYQYYGTRKGLKSGWVTVGDKEYYFNPQTFQMVKKKWIDGKYLGEHGYVTKREENNSHETENENGSMDYAWSKSYIVWNESNAVNGELLEEGNGKYRFKLTDGSYYVGVLYYYGESKYEKKMFFATDDSGYGYLAYHTSFPEAVSESGWYYKNGYLNYAAPVKGKLITAENGFYQFKLENGEYLTSETVYNKAVYTESTDSLKFDGNGYAACSLGTYGSENCIRYNGRTVKTFEEARLGLLSIEESYFREFYEKWLHSDMTELEKYLTVVRYLDSFDLKYDLDSGNNGVLEFLEKRKGVCMDWANLTYLLCIVAELDAVIVRIPGLNHAANLVKIDGCWHYTDNTSKSKGFYNEGRPFLYDRIPGGVSSTVIGWDYRLPVESNWNPLSEYAYSFDSTKNTVEVIYTAHGCVEHGFSADSGAPCVHIIENWSFDPTTGKLDFKESSN